MKMLILAAICGAGLMFNTGCASCCKKEGSCSKPAISEKCAKCCKDAASCGKCCKTAEDCAKCCK